MVVVRWLLGCIILLLNFIFTPKSPQRDNALQAKVDAQTKGLSLYQLPACPFCVKVRRQIKRQGLSIGLCNIKETNYREELVGEGGKHKVPCLKISTENGQDKWLYESKEIIRYLKRFAT